MRACLAAIAAVLLIAAAPVRGQEPILNPHTREACLHCHKEGVAGPERTRIFPSSDEPHAAVARGCRSCHKEGAQDFWLLILPAPAGRPAAGAAPPAAPAPRVSAPPAAAPPVAASRPGPPVLPAPQPLAPQRPAPPPAEPAPAATPPAGAAATGAVGAGEGFENSHDAMDCAACHDKPADQLKRGASAPPRFAQEGVDTFCRSCHAAVDGSHFPRKNLPPAGTTCLNCHRTHGRSLLFPDLRDDFPTVVAESTGLNPHGGKIFCLACHPDTPQAGQPVTFRFPGNQARLCQRCHSGVEHHPLGVKSTAGTWKMDFARFPLENEAVTCVTCHKPPECLATAGADGRFLRGGPYNSTAEFCARCHEDKKFSSLNPHDQIDENGEIYRKKCLYCHVTQPEPGAAGDTLRYTDTLNALCASCHQIGPHPDTDHLKPLPPRMRDNLSAYEELRQVRLPLDEGNVTCVTCHNPHERGLLKGAAGVGADEVKKMRLTTFNEQCTPCHGRH